MFQNGLAARRELRVAHFAHLVQDQRVQPLSLLEVALGELNSAEPLAMFYEQRLCDWNSWEVKARARLQFLHVS